VLPVVFFTPALICTGTPAVAVDCVLIVSSSPGESSIQIGADTAQSPSVCSTLAK